MGSSTPPFHRYRRGESYGSTDTPLSPDAINGHDETPLIGEDFLHTDNEEETPFNSSSDILKLVEGKNNGVGSSYQKDQASSLDPEYRDRPTEFSILGCFHSRGHHPVGHITRVVSVIGMAICMYTVAMALQPNNAPGGISDAGGKADRIKFPAVDRGKYGAPPYDTIDTKLFDPSLFNNVDSSKRRPDLVAEHVQHPDLHRFLRVPFPTGAFWTNLVLKSDQKDGLSFPVVAYPYAFKWSNLALRASYPPVHRKMDNTSVVDHFIPDITFSTEEEVRTRHVTAFDPLSVTTKFTTNTAGYWESYLVQGSPYITIKYKGATPLIKPQSTFRNVVCPFDEAGNYNDANAPDEPDAADVPDAADDNLDDLPDDQNTSRKLKWGVCTQSHSSKGRNLNTTTLQGVQFFLQTQEGLTWMVFASEPLILSFNKNNRKQVMATEKFTGVLRFALIPPSPSQDGKSADSTSAPIVSSTGLRRLIYHSQVYPVGGSVKWDFRTGYIQPSLAKKDILGTRLGSGTGSAQEQRIGTIHFKYETKSMTETSQAGQNGAQNSLLMLALPHHAQSLRSDVMLDRTQFDLVYDCIKGMMTPVLGGVWSYEEPLTSIGFDTVNSRGKSRYSKIVYPEIRHIIMENVKEDIKINLPNPNGNAYAFGKEIARLAQLAHIADLMAPIPREEKQNQTSQNALFITTKHAVETLQYFMSRFLRNEIRTSKFLFDANFGGIVTETGLSDSRADFGNGWYNDHHSHYGYILYACATLARLSPTFLHEYGSAVDALFYDVAYNSNTNSESVDGASFFPLARHKSWFDGHSWASGLFPFTTGKSQESSSEAVNCYYGAYLWSLVRYEAAIDGDSELVDFTKLLLATEIRGAKTYWHMVPFDKGVAERLHPLRLLHYPAMAENYMVGNLGMLDAVCSTWFGKKRLYVHMINLMPVTAITSELFDKSYAKLEFNSTMKPMLSDAEMTWKGYVISDHAISDPNAAWKEAQDLISHQLDTGLSKSQVLHWISTRPGFEHNSSAFNSSDLMNSYEPEDEPPPAGVRRNATAFSAACESHGRCAALGLTSWCCPTLDNKMLGCCD